MKGVSCLGGCLMYRVLPAIRQRRDISHQQFRAQGGLAQLHLEIPGTRGRDDEPNVCRRHVGFAVQFAPGDEADRHGRFAAKAAEPGVLEGLHGLRD